MPIRHGRMAESQFGFFRGAAAGMAAELCGGTLARAHARSGDAAAISGYLGKGDVFGKALGRFATSYADQTARDHAALVQAITDGRVMAESNV